MQLVCQQQIHTIHEFVIYWRYITYDVIRSVKLAIPFALQSQYVKIPDNMHRYTARVRCYMIRIRFFNSILQISRTHKWNL
jgi:hypothetical protein